MFITQIIGQDTARQNAETGSRRIMLDKHVVRQRVNTEACKGNWVCCIYTADYMLLRRE